MTEIKEHMKACLMCEASYDTHPMTRYKGATYCPDCLIDKKESEALAKYETKIRTKVKNSKKIKVCDLSENGDGSLYVITDEGGVTHVPPFISLRKRKIEFALICTSPSEDVLDKYLTFLKENNATNCFLS